MRLEAKNSLPSRRTHGKISKLLLGKSFPQVDAALDSASQYMGKSHRRVLHAPLEAIVVGLLVSLEAKGAASAAVHVLTDMLDAVAKRQIDNVIKNGEEKNVREENEKKSKRKEK
jgi:hypothetical protein